MSERLIVDVYFATEGDLYTGKLDEWGDITVCGTSYIGFGGMKTNFIDRRDENHPICHILVKLENFREIANALSENNVEIGPPEVDRKPASSISAELLESLS
ncbi:hypothetical protein HYW39_01095 [Candidatus Curtissbacteria bacterium]|nr:hypothetical protein [Candidatus Curtissbacteria bacterium]